jgi:hypothetical protein
MSVTKNNDPDIVKAFVAAERIGRFDKPEEIATAVLWLCGPGASFMIDMRWPSMAASWPSLPAPVRSLPCPAMSEVV